MRHGSVFPQAGFKYQKLFNSDIWSNFQHSHVFVRKNREKTRPLAAFCLFKSLINILIFKTYSKSLPGKEITVEL